MSKNLAFFPFLKLERIWPSCIFHNLFAKAFDFVGCLCHGLAMCMKYCCSRVMVLVFLPSSKGQDKSKWAQVMPGVV